MTQYPRKTNETKEEHVSLIGYCDVIVLSDDWKLHGAFRITSLARELFEP